MINKAILMGRLTRDPEIRYSASGVAVARFTLAVDRRFVKQGEQRQADFINIVAFRQTAEFVGKYFVKGQLVAVVGSIQTRSWDGEDGQKRYATEVIAEEAHFAESKRDRQNDNSFNNDYNPNFAPADNQQPSNNDDFIPVDDDDGLPF